MKKLSNVKFIAPALAAIIVAGLAYLYVPTIAAQPGTNYNEIVTRQFVEMRLAQLAEELRGNVPTATPPTGTSNISASERDALFAEIMAYFEIMYGERLNQALAHVPGPRYVGQVTPFTTLNPQAGQSIIFNEGAEFILRGGSASAITGANGIPDVTAGEDVLNGDTIGLNHLMMIPRSDGRGVAFHTDSWIMVRGGFTWR